MLSTGSSHAVLSVGLSGVAAPWQSCPITDPFNDVREVGIQDLAAGDHLSAQTLEPSSFLFIKGDYYYHAKKVEGLGF